MNDIKEIACFLFAMALLVVFVVMPCVQGYRARVRRGCPHVNPVVFNLGAERDHTFRHCFTCGCSQIDEHAWKDHGVRSGDEICEALAELDEVFTPEEHEGDVPEDDDTPPALGLPNRVIALWQRIGGNRLVTKPTHLVLGRSELLEAMALLVAGLERAEEWALAGRVKNAAPNVEDELFLRLVQERLVFHGMNVVPDLTKDSILAIESE